MTRTCQAIVLPRKVIDEGMYVCTIDSESSSNVAKFAAKCVQSTAQFDEIMHDFFACTVCVHGCVCVCVCARERAWMCVHVLA